MVVCVCSSIDAVGGLGSLGIFMSVTHNEPLSVGKAVNDIKSSNKSIIAEPMIKSDLLLLSTFHSFFMFPHFKFLQGGDKSTECASEQIKQANKVNRFFTTFLRILNKYFYRVVNSCLICALGGEPDTVRT